MRVKFKRDPITYAGDYSYHKRPSLIVRVRPTGHASWMGFAVWEEGKPPTTRWLDNFYDVSLEEVADEWEGLNRRRRKEQYDPLDARRQRRVEAQRQRETEVGKLLETFIRDRVAALRTARETEQRVRKALAVWAKRSVDSLTVDDMRELIKDTRKRGDHAARNGFAQVSSFMSWCLHQGVISTNPCAAIRIDALLPPRVPKQRVLTDAECRTVWHSAGEIPIFGAAVQLLLLTGLRLNEVLGLRWQEISFETAIVTIPPERFKSGVSHTLPLVPDALDILQAQPKIHGSDLVFTVSGRNPIGNITKRKDQLDALIKTRLDMPHWTLHDLRRTTRTRLASLKTPPHIAEMILGHGRKGMARVYDQHLYLDEMRSALLEWATLLRKIIAVHPA